jgi:SNF2 family DNA or RNA helicase
MILRHITGLAKINPILEYIDEFAEEYKDEPWKLAIFHHHIDVGEILSTHITNREIGFTKILSSYDAQKRYDNLETFRNDRDTHIMLFPSLAASEGFDLDFVSTGIMLEREWNPANEEQVEGRFIRATREMLERARSSEGLKVNMLYPVAINTIDEFFCELVERKRQFVKESLSGRTSENPWNESQIMLDLAQIAIKRMKEVGISQ